MSGMTGEGLREAGGECRKWRRGDSRREVAHISDACDQFERDERRQGGTDYGGCDGGELGVKGGAQRVSRGELQERWFIVCAPW